MSRGVWTAETRARREQRPMQRVPHGASPGIAVEPWVDTRNKHRAEARAKTEALRDRNPGGT